MSGLKAIIEQETLLLADFVTLLEQEQDALKRADTGPLPEIGEAKANLVARLNALEVSRNRALGQTEEALTADAMLQRLLTMPGGQQIADLWKHLLELARRAKSLHDLNGQLVQMHLQQTNELLAALTQPAERNTMYSSNGQARLTTGSRIVDSA